ncbi:hypothetical protein V7149_00330 [Bacillus sp. JJ1503]|uniref:hypothetical protein n=1 Tax=Bacillus sp. JJ1503 TaxID=3122956 RepID=UPI002FFF0CB0
MVNGKIKNFTHVAQENADVFFEKVSKRLQELANLDVEVQYQCTMQPNGVALFSAVIIGREVKA